MCVTPLSPSLIPLCQGSLPLDELENLGSITILRTYKSVGIFKYVHISSIFKKQTTMLKLVNV